MKTAGLALITRKKPPDFGLIERKESLIYSFHLLAEDGDLYQWMITSVQ